MRMQEVQVVPQSICPTQLTRCPSALHLQNQDSFRWRYLVTFVSRGIADEWWRAVSDSSRLQGYRRFAGVTRVSAQWYIYDPEAGDISDTVNDDRCAKFFNGKVFFTLLHDRNGRLEMPMAPSLDFTENRSGDA